MRSIDDITRPKEYLSPEDGVLGNIVREWAEKEVIPNRRRFDEDWREHRLIEPAFRKLMVDMGMQKASFPEDLGGLGMGHSEHLGTNAFRVTEEIARADSGMAVSYGVTFWPLFMICNEPHVNRRLCEEFAPMLCEATEPCFAANAMTEPQGGADIVRDIEVIRITGYQYARMIDRPDLYGERWSDEMVAKGRVYKYFASDRAVEDLGKAMNLMGAYGADREWDVEKHWRDLMIIQLWMGGKQLCQMETARWFYGCETL